VRRERSAPPGLAGADEDRKQVFQSALAQAEELWDAAAVAGAASRPLPLFYCVSQAGRAVCAAWTQADEWRPNNHGLKRRESDAGNPGARALDHAAAVNSHPLGIYAMVAAATASSTFEGFATVADLWASLPGWPTPHALFGTDRPRCIAIEAVRVPGDTRSRLKQVAGPTHAALRVKKLNIDELPAVYPTMAGVQQDGTRKNAFGFEEPVYKFVDNDGKPRPLYEVGERAPGSPRLSGNYVVRPRVGDAPIGPPSVFLTLWALLFCLSELARYYPDVWVGALDPDRSRAAVTLSMD
jgi:YaaC-like protein